MASAPDRWDRRGLLICETLLAVAFGIMAAWLEGQGKEPPTWLIVVLTAICSQIGTAFLAVYRQQREDDAEAIAAPRRKSPRRMKPAENSESHGEPSDDPSERVEPE